ncbi:hypothetical protein K9M79_02765 [Candidatus Woesearchaeota archaeon]|nr:hypothetical protein [Candidatus Woesearchaeota archaeon]
MKRALIVVATLLVLTTVIYFIFFQPKEQVELPEYPQDPQGWIHDAQMVKKIDIDYVTKGKSYEDRLGQQVKTNNISTVFNMRGYYLGNKFYKNYTSDGQTYIRVSPNMIPSDGIIEGYVIFDVINDTPAYRIFVDEDWKKRVQPTNIWWGFGHGNQKEFEFNEVKRGIYMDTVYDNPSSFSDDYKVHYYKLFIGDMTEEKIAASNDKLTFVIME